MSSMFAVTPDQLKDAVVRRVSAIAGRARIFNTDPNVPGLEGGEYLTKFIACAETLVSKCDPALNAKPRP